MHSLTSNFCGGTSNRQVNYIDSFFLSSLRLIIICSDLRKCINAKVVWPTTSSAKFRELLSAERVDGATGLFRRKYPDNVPLFRRSCGFS